MNRNELLKEIETLPTEQRMLIAEYILASLNPTDSDIEATWKNEVKRRMEAVNKGQNKVIPSEELHNELYDIIDNKK